MNGFFRHARFAIAATPIMVHASGSPITVLEDGPSLDGIRKNGTLVTA